MKIELKFYFKKPGIKRIIDFDNKIQQNMTSKIPALNKYLKKTNLKQKSIQHIDNPFKSHLL